MSLKHNLQMYNTDKIEDSNLLDKIYKNVSKSCSPGAKNFFKIDKIIEAFNDLNHVLWKFENECENSLDSIKKYILGYKLDAKEVKKIETIMIEWGMLFPGIGIDPILKDILITKYRQEFIVDFIEEKKKKYYDSIYTEYLLLVKKLSKTNQQEQLNILENIKDKSISECFWNCLTKPSNKNVFKNKLINIDEKYIQKLRDKEFLLKTIKDILRDKFKEESYKDYESDLKKIYIIQGDTKNWIDVNKLNNLIEDKKLKLLKYAHLINEINEKNTHIIQLSELAFCIINNNFIENWTSDKYILEYENIALVPFDANPMIISKYIFNEEYILKEKDFLLIFKKKVKKQ